MYYLLQFFDTAILSGEGQSLIAGLVVSWLFYLNYRKLQYEIDRQEMLDRFLKP